MKNIVRLVISLLSLTFLVIGLTINSYSGLLTGAIIYLLSYILIFWEGVNAAEQFRKTKAVVKNDNSVAEVVAYFSNAVIAIIGLVLLVDDRSSFSTIGLMIWGGTVLAYVIVGIIASSVGNIPLVMTLGGWKVKRARRRKR